MKKCTKCEVFKDEKDYYSRGDGYGLRSKCKVCVKERNKNYEDNNKDKVLMWKRICWHRNKLKYRTV